VLVAAVLLAGCQTLGHRRLVQYLETVPASRYIGHHYSGLLQHYECKGPRCALRGYSSFDRDMEVVMEHYRAAPDSSGADWRYVRSEMSVRLRNKGQRPLWFRAHFVSPHGECSTQRRLPSMRWNEEAELTCLLPDLIPDGTGFAVFVEVASDSTFSSPITWIEREGVAGPPYAYRCRLAGQNDMAGQNDAPTCVAE